MTSTENAPLPEQHTPWARIATQCKLDYERTTGERFDAWLIGEVANHPIRAADMMEPVPWGFARKAWARMRHTCQRCGKPGRVRSGSGGGVAVRCGACHVTSAFALELEVVLNDSSAHPGEERIIWIAHELPPLIRAALPEHCWRQTPLPSGGRISYVTASDMRVLTPWLTRLAMVLSADDTTGSNSNPTEE